MTQYKKYKLSYFKNEKKTSKAGKTYFALSAKVEGDETWYNGLGNAGMNYQPGDTVMARLYEEEYQGKMYKRIEFPSKMMILEERVDQLEKGMRAIVKHLKGEKPKQDTTPLSIQTTIPTGEAAAAEVFPDDFINSLDDDQY